MAQMRQQGPQGDTLFDDEFAANFHKDGTGGYGAMPNKDKDLEQQQIVGLNYKELLRGMCSFGNSAVSNVLMFVLLPWVMFTVVMCPFAVGYHRFAVLAWVLFTAALSGSISLVYSSFTAWGQPKLYWRWLGMLCLLATLLGMTLGLYDYYKYGQGYYVYQASRVYSDVSATDSPGAYQDAGTITFSDQAAIDTSRAVGYKDRGSLFCVAPVIDTTQLEVPKPGAIAPQVGFWAAGIDCCEPRGAFWCGPLLETKVRGGLVVRDATPFIHKVVPSFQTAVQEAATAYGLQAPEDSILVEWTQDTSLAGGDIWSQCTGFYSRAVSAYLIVLICIVVIGALIYDTSQRPSKGLAGKR